MQRLSTSGSEWRGYVAVCLADGTDPLPVTLDGVEAWWASRVLGEGLKSSALKSATSRLLTHAALLGHAVPPDTREAISRELTHFCTGFPCEVAAAAPPLGDAGDGRLELAITYAAARAETSLLYRSLHALLLVSQALYCRPTALLDGHLRRGQVMAVPATASASGGLVLRLLLPKRRKDRVDMRLDSFPIPTGPATRALLSLLNALEQLTRDTSADAVVFPDVCPTSDTLRGPALSTSRARDLLRRYVFTPAGLPGGDRLTLRSIRSGASTDAAAAGVGTTDRLAQGGWASAAGAQTYLDRCVVSLTGPSPQSA